MGDELLVSLREVSVRFGRGRNDKSAVTAVDRVNLDLVSGRTLGLVGESGSGKSTLARVVAGLQKPTGGSIQIHTSATSARDRRREIQMVFQDPFSSLNPYMKVGSLIQEAWSIHPSAAPRGGRRSAAAEMLERVGLTEAHLDRRPHQLSGGQRQRVGIARALAARPRLLVCDEAVSALDVSVQAGVLNLFQDLQRDLGLSYLFISHDMAVIAHLSDQIAVMYKGELVEFGTRDAICYAPTNPYTAALIASARGERTEQVERP